MKTMPPDGLEALRQTIRGKWYDLFFGRATSKECALCVLYRNTTMIRINCTGCPVFLYTDKINCVSTPYWDYREHLEAIHGVDNEYIEKIYDCCHEFIREELLFLFKVLKESKNGK
jgi:hypothetical protein